MPRPAPAPVVLLAGRGESTWIVAAALRERFGRVPVIVEDHESRARFLRRRFRKVGWWRGLGQALFLAFAPLGRRLAAHRRRELLAQLPTPLPADAPDVFAVASANGKRAQALLAAFAPQVVVVNGTRILKPATLALAPVFLNLHAGITPRYRGVHGGYWALASDDAGNFGATVHRVDAGVDTGAVLEHVRLVPGPDDGFFTYPLLQLAAGLPALLRWTGVLRHGAPPAADAAAADVASRQWFHPTLTQYLRTGWREGVW
jgi:phosphoribosylglycinamide formyltransferase-1